MKKIFLLSAAVLGILVTASCSKEYAGADSVTTIISASIAQSRTALGEKDGASWPNYWKAGDQISVNGVVSEALGAEADGNASASFSFSGAIGTPYYAAYPAAAVSNYSDGFATLTLPRSQAYVEGSYDPAAFLMSGTSSEAGTVVLSPCVGVFHLSLSGTGSISKVRLTGADDAALSGDFLTDFEADFSPSVVYNTIEMAPAAAVALPADFFICVPAGLSGNVQVEVFDADGGSMTKTATLKSALTAGKMYSPGTLAYTPSYDIAITAEGITSSTAVICWDNAPAPAYTISVYADADCGTLVNSYAVPADDACWSGESPRFCISGLSAGETYFVKVTNVAKGVDSNVLPVTMADFEIVEVSSTPAEEGDVLLAEDFSELCWDCDMIGQGAGFFPESMDYFGNTENPEFKAVSTSNEKVIGNQSTALILSRLQHWAQGANNTLYIHPGYVKLVGSSKPTHIVTPALDNIPAGKYATLSVELTASRYYSASSGVYETEKAIVAVQPAGDYNEIGAESNKNTLDLESNIANITLPAEASWNTFTVTLSGVCKGDRLAFGAHKSAEKNTARMNLSDIKVTLLSLEDAGDLIASAKGVSTSTATFSWTHYGWTAAEDIAKPYTAALYRDAACTDLVVSYNFAAEEECWVEKTPCFVFGGLNPGTEYWFQVTDTESGVVSTPVSATTEAFTVVDATTVTNAAVGDVILAEDFSEIGAGPDETAAAAGFVPSSKVLPFVPSGVSPVGVFKPYMVGYDPFGDRIFGAGWDLGSSRLSKGWGFFGGSSCYYGAGYLRLATSSGRTHIVTPALSGIPAGKIATIEVTVTACKYESSANDVAVFVEKGLEMNETDDPSSGSYKKYTGASLDLAYGLGITSVKEWETESVTISGVDADCQLVIGSLDDISKKNRFYLSDVMVTILSLEEPGLEASVKSVSSSSAAFTWTYGSSAAEDIAKPYTYALYRDAACTDLVVSFESTADADRWYGKTPCFVFGGLQPATQYWFKVTDTENGKVSDPVSATTEAFTVVDATTVTDAAVGDVILAEDFSEMGAGPDELAEAAGFVPSSKVLPFIPSGASPEGGYASYRTTSGPYGDRIFGAGWDLGSSRLSKGWGFIGNSACYYGAGYLRLATSSGRTHIVTPALSGIPAGKVASIEVTVTASKYEKNDNDVAVFVEKGLAMDETTDLTSGSYRKYSGASLSDGDGFGITSAKAWDTKSVQITNVDAECQLVIGSLDDISGKNRVYISDVKVQITALADDPVFAISDDASFNAFVSAVAGGDKTLEARVAKDITLSSATVEAFASIEDYAGTLNGYGHSISGLTKPMFNDLKGTVKDLTLNSTLNVTADQLDLGILAKVLSGTADGCTSQGSVYFNVDGGVTGEHHIGGLVGLANSGAEVKDCTNEAAVTNDTASASGNGSELMVGGLIGTFWGETFNISGCDNTGDVINNAYWNKDISVGGIVGQAGNSDGLTCNLMVEDCTNSGDVANNGDTDAAEYVGGIAGWVRYGTYSGNTNTGDIENAGDAPNNYVGGLIGYIAKGATLDDNSNSGAVSNSGASTRDAAGMGTVGGNFVGGLIGRMQTDNTFKTNSNSGIVYNSGDANNGQYIGGIVGYLDKNNVISEYGGDAKYKLTNSGDIENAGSAKNLCIGGLFGRNSSGAFQMTGSSTMYSTNSGSITDTSGPAKSNGGDLCIGGIAGYTTTGIKTQYARNSGDIYVTGDKGGTCVNVGGIGGWISNASFNFNNCRNTGNVTVDCTTTASLWVAGIVGCPKPNTTTHYYWRSNAVIDTHLATVGGENYTAGLMGTVEGTSANTFTMYGHRLAGTVWGSTTKTGLFCCTKTTDCTFSLQGGSSNPNRIAPGTVLKDNSREITITDIADVTTDVIAGGVGSTYDITTAGDNLVVEEW